MGMAAITAYAQDSVFTGLVKDRKTGRVLPASVSFTGTANHMAADSNGVFVMTGAAGKHTIRISHTGYFDLTREIRLPGTADFLLSPTETELEQVVVTAVATATRIKRTPVSIAIVSQKEMNRNTSSNVIDAVLKTVPGISAITTGPNISKPLIRGLGYTRVLTLYDGLRQEGQQWGDEHGVEIDQYGVAKAEIVKGPASLMYGSDAIAGVVNLIPGLPAINDAKLHGDALIEYQSNNGLIGGTASLQYKRNGFMWSGRFSDKQAGNYRNAVDGRVYNTGFTERNFSALAGLEKPKSKNYIQFNLYNNLQEIPDGSRDSLTRLFTYQVQEPATDDIRSRPLVPASRLFTYSISSLHQHIQHTRLYHKSSWQVGNSELSTLIGFQQNRRREYNHPTATYQPGLDIQLNTYNYELKYAFPEWSGFRLTYGVNGMYQDNRNLDATDFPIPDYNLFDIGSYLVAKKDFKKWVITGGIRIDSRDIRWADFYTRNSGTGFIQQVRFPDTLNATHNFPSYRKNFSGASGSLGFVYNASGALTIKANIARGYRCPSIPEIGSDGLDPGARIYYIGNRNFSPEFNWQADLGLFLNYPDADINLELFNNAISNYIFLQKLFAPNGQPLEMVPGNFTYQYLQGSARIYGAEAGWIIHPRVWKWFHLQQNMAMINGINTDKSSLKLLGDDAKYLPLIPAFRTASRLRITLIDQQPRIEDCFLQTELETYATQNRFYAVDNTETATPGYALVNIGAGISFRNKKGNPFCSLSITANNLFDVAYQSHQNRLKYFEYYQQSPNNRSGIYNIGRNIAAKLIVNW
ncbi:TonB-dependent receptor [Sediminibacterium sp. WSJ-3]|nr:TonB-dependent receptor [Sediminibacterium soli]